MDNDEKGSARGNPHGPILLLGLLVLISEGHAFRWLESLNRFQFGAAFRHHGKLYNDVDTWSHTFEIRLTPIAFPTLPIPPCSNPTPFFCSFKSVMLRHFNELATNITKDVQATFELVEQMVGRSKPPPVSNSRSKRAILPFVGDLASSLFGVATSSDVRKLQKHVSRPYKMQISLSAGSVAFLNKVSSYMKTSNHRMDNLIGSIMSMHSRMDNITDILEQEDIANQRTQHAVLSLVPIVFSKLQQITRLERRLESLLLGVTSLTHRQLSPMLIDHNTLIRTLHDIQRTLSRTHPAFKVVHMDPRYYYHSSRVLYAGQVEQILLVIDVPIASTTTSFDLYQVSCSL
ncbi:uncharacterized protein LOC143298147 [Babylonia areolata]|uniref:uncharacterized protein LOC143298147 n=1 Tax=Babylonia areolata TaxID=304850 RepID=UPI003FD16860